MKIVYSKSKILQIMFCELGLREEFHNLYYQKLMDEKKLNTMVLRKLFVKFLKSKGYDATYENSEVMISINDKDYSFYTLKYG